MLDIKFIKENPSIVKDDLKKRDMLDKILWVDDVISLDDNAKKLDYKIQELRRKRNEITDDIRELKKSGKGINDKVNEMKNLPAKIKEEEDTLAKINEKIEFIMQNLPNILHDSVPIGKTEEDNKVEKKWGKLPKFDFEVISHVDVLQKLDLVDTERASKVAGSRFYYLKNDLVLMDIALQRLALDILYSKGFTIMEVPLMINKRSISGAITLQDFENVIYKIQDEDLYMIGTSEHSLACYHMDELIDEDKLPVRYAGVSSCFRKEAGSHGKDTKGIFRVHQFNKVEQFVFCKPEDSWKWHEELIKNAEEFYQLLKLPYRIVNICTADIGSIAAKKYDIEAWFPVQKAYREVVSCSNCTDYQSRKLNIRFGKEGKPGKQLVHTLNSTMVATSRTIAAILENYQQKDGSILVPKALQKYMGKKVIK